MFMTDWLSSANESSQAKRKRLRLNLLLMILLTYAGTAFGISTMRCGHNLIELQDDKYTVLEICGEPEYISYRTKIVGSILHHPRRTLDIQQFEEVQVEEWVYNFGRNRIKQLLRFENGILVEISDLQRGR
ncbi:Protein of unknown function (DUF2845) [Methylomicrobium album BG8]|uniref:DUF2845 domain-containing protein n=2 Tax=Methylomicrobium TaxID=39773 RepID=H8GN12_METAL|nr:Protein of unknown function (DUF2845) [Methylomicrobium album BG8]